LSWWGEGDGEGGGMPGACAARELTTSLMEGTNHATY
jgi:hypothetical protein